MENPLKKVYNIFSWCIFCYSCPWKVFSCQTLLLSVKLQNCFTCPQFLPSLSQEQRWKLGWARGSLVCINHTDCSEPLVLLRPTFTTALTETEPCGKTPGSWVTAAVPASDSAAVRRLLMDQLQIISSCTKKSYRWNSGCTARWTVLNRDSEKT